MQTDLLVIGAGPGGYHAAIRAAQLGLKVAVAERDRVGGICLNDGCIPARALLAASERIRAVREGSHFGLRVDWELDLTGLDRYRARTVQHLTNGVRGLLRGNGVTVLRGEAHLGGEGDASVGEEKVTFRNALVATGSRPGTLPGTPVDGERVLDSTAALQVRSVPQRLLVVGGGASGLEIASIYRRLGAQVLVLEAAGQLAPTADEEMAAALAGVLARQGVESVTGARVRQVRREGDEVLLEVEEGENTREERADAVVVAIGRTPVTDGLGLDSVGIERDDSGFIKVDDQLRTSRQRVFACGDVVGYPMFAHKAMHQGLAVAALCAGHPPPRRPKHLPGYVYTSPELAWVGATETALRASGRALLVGRFPVSALGRAGTMGVTEGLAKVLADARTGEVLGVHVLGPRAEEVIAEAALAMELGATLDDLHLTVHPHPTLVELLPEVASVALGQPIHTLKRRER